MKAIIADTTPLYGAIDTSDQYHSRSQAELRRIESEDLTVIISFPVYNSVSQSHEVHQNLNS
ncbi:hypothetical protein N0824_01085 [Microcystis sp. 0824]|uniref:hypothetical protein n=1 Tax=Microcystis sp. 0824 TaxID=1502726 RepID=UPI000D0C24BB|nr:hypothetical protein [Microcystis sp. 0824]GBF53233.1 hypothetical protein N0824_01085 [Microcystis sp. 0824]